MHLQLAITSAPADGQLLLDATPFVTACTITTNEHGPESIDATVERSLYDAFRLYNAPGVPHVALNNGAESVSVGRLEDPGLAVGRTNALTLAALGYWRSLSDLPYTALWSDTSLASWFLVQVDQFADVVPDRYTFTTDENALTISPQKGSTQGSTVTVRLGFTTPNGSSRSIVGIQYSYELMAPASWETGLQTFNPTLPWTFTSSQWSLVATGVPQRGAVYRSHGGTNIYAFYLYLNAAGATVAAENGAIYLKITNVRVVTSTAQSVSTTLTANRAAGAGVTATVGSTAGMYVGQYLVMNSGSATSEMIVVTSITNGTQFVATFVNSYTSGQTVQGHRVLASEIMSDFVSQITAVNPAQLSSDTSGIQLSTVDIPDAVYADASMADTATALAGMGSTAYEVGVDTRRRFFFRLRGSRARTWFIDVDDLRLTRSLDGMYNSTYATYQNASGATVRSATSTNTVSVLRYGITRRRAVDVQTSNTTYATQARDAALVDAALVEPRAEYTVSQVFGTGGAPVPLWFVQPGDSLVLRNLPPAVVTGYDTIRTFRITRTTYDPVAGTLAIEPEAPLPTLDVLVAQQ